jgi:hypothetical protein
MQSAKMPTDSFHQCDSPVQASIVYVEFDSAITILHPIRIERVTPSLIANVSSIGGDATCGRYAMQSSIKFP